MSTTIKVTALISREKRVLLIKEWSKKRQGFFWNVIKGTYDGKKDHDLVTTAVREAREEASLNVLPTGLLSVFLLKRGENTIIQFNLCCSVRGKHEPKIRKKYEKDEAIAELRWFTKKDFQKLKLHSLFSKRTRDILVDYFGNKKFASLTLLKNCNELR